MTYPEPLLSFPPAPGPLFRLFQNYPALPGLYGDFWEGDVWVTGNHAAELAELSRQGVSVLALDSGGLPLRSALALGHLRRADLLTVINNLPDAQRPSRLYLPQSLTAAWGLTGNLNQIPVTPLPDFVPLPAPLETLAAALRLFPGQALLFSLPLLLFGWQAWLMGILALLAAACGVGILWGLLPLPPFLRGLGLGFLLSLALAALSWNTLPQIWPRLMGLVLAPLWYTFLMLGTRR